MDIRVIDNIEILVPIYIAAFNGEPWNEKWTIESATKALKEIRTGPRFYGLAFFDKGEPIGAILGNIRTYDASQVYYIDHLFVSPDHRRQGAASKLYQNAIEDLKEKGVKGAFFTTIRNSPAYDFYIKHGAIDVPNGSVMYHPF